MAALLKDKILVGHALKNDLTVLLLSHPRKMTRDTATYRPYMRVSERHPTPYFLACSILSISSTLLPESKQPKGRNGGKFRPRALRDLSAQIFGIKIQSGEHDPVIVLC